MNTAQYRKMAREFYDKGDYKNAEINFKLAIQNYPNFHEKSQLYVNDYSSLKEWLDMSIKAQSIK